MPIAREFRQFYGREWREVTRPRILKRAGNKCERCRVPNHAEVIRIGGCWLEQRVSWKDGRIQTWRGPDGRPLLDKPRGPTRRVRIVITIAHLNHTPGDDVDENLKAMCQWCHLNHDKQHHKESRSTRKDAQRPLLKELYA
jgi:hypothetical protein